MSKHLVLYDRLSTSMQEDNFSREDAAGLAPKMAAQHGFTSWEIRPEVASGESLVNRPMIQAILDDVTAGKVQAIGVQNFARLSRDADGVDAFIIKKILKEHGCLVITPGRVFDFAQESDDKMSDIEFLVGRWHKGEMLKYLMQGKKGRATAGYYNGGVPKFGYKLKYIPIQTKKGEKMTADLTIDETKKETVKLIFGLVIEKGLTPTARYLNENNIPSAKGKSWTAKSVSNLIKSPLCYGLLSWGNVIQSRFLKDCEPIEVNRPDLAIVDPLTWERANLALKARSTHNRQPGKWVKHPFAGILRCPHCGGGMYSANFFDKRWNTYRRRYICTNKGINKCDHGYHVSHSVAYDAIILLVADFMQNQLLLENVLGEAATRFGQTASEEEIRTGIEAELLRVKQAKSRIVKAIAAGTLTDDEAKEQLTELREKESSLNRDLQTIQQKAKIRASYVTAIGAIRGRDIKATLETLGDDKLGRFLRLIFKSIVLHVTGKSRASRATVASYELTDDLATLLEQESISVYRFSDLHKYLLDIFTVAAPCLVFVFIALNRGA